MCATKVTLRAAGLAILGATLAVGALFVLERFLCQACLKVWPTLMGLFTLSATPL